MPSEEQQPHLEVEYDAGTIVVRDRHKGPETWNDKLPEGFVFDARIDAYRGAALDYRPLMLRLVKNKIAYTDNARRYEKIDLVHQAKFPPRPYQKEAIDAWIANGGMGVAVLPTGAGKSFLAELAMQYATRPALIVTPTLDLMHQWYDGLGAAFGQEIGLLGGGYHELRDVTVTTYDSAHIHMERIGNRFGIIVFDEVHHLPGASRSFAAESCLAPFRLGLTATPKRSDGGEEKLDRLVGRVVYSMGIKGLAGVYLAKYRTIRVEVELSAHEREQYLLNREIYVQFRVINNIQMSSQGAWQQFIKATSRSKEGRKAWLAYRNQRRIALCCRAKLDYLERILRLHPDDRVIVFTNDNDTVYEISRLFLMPAITYQTPTKERKEILERFNAGTYPAIVTSRVLNEGVNVPEASVAVILSGTSSVREHVQRLGRILRRGDGQKKAVLYELVAEGTNEGFVSDRRRDHEAYQ